MAASSYICKKCGVSCGRDSKSLFSQSGCPVSGKHTMVKDEDISHWVCSKCGATGSPSGTGGCRNGKNHSWTAIRR